MSIFTEQIRRTDLVNLQVQVVSEFLTKITVELAKLIPTQGSHLYISLN